MKKAISIVMAAMMLMSACTVFATTKNDESVSATSAQVSFDTYDALYAHAVAGSSDTEAWHAWQSVHDEDFAVANETVKYFFLPTSADESKVEIYNAYSSKVTVGAVEIAAGQSETVDYSTTKSVSVKAGGKTYTLKFMKSNAEAAIYINNSNADGAGKDLMTYLNETKSNSAKATGAIVDADGSIDSTPIKKIKGRGNTTWSKPKKAYNITYDSKVSIAGMDKSKKYSILANYQDDSLSRNRFLYDLSDAVGMPYASDSRYVDFYSNGYYWGSYQMTEKVEVGKDYLVDSFEETDYLNADGTVKEDFPFLCEVDASAKDGEDYYFESSSGNKVTIKCPELESGDAGYEEVKAYAKNKFDAFYNAIKKKTTSPSDYADVNSLAKIYLINELGKNWDSGVSSLFFTYKQDSSGNYKFYASPVWDYDNSLGNARGVDYELNYIGVNDYEEYTGWWCKYKGKKSSSRSHSNVMNYISRNDAVLDASVQIWFEKFVPAINHFAGEKTNAVVNRDFYTAEEYYNLLKGSADMNYTSGWLLDTGDWIADHTSLNVAHFDLETKAYVVDNSATAYAQNFDGTFNYCRDWLISRAAWLSSEMAADYVPPKYSKGDVNLDGRVNVFDATEVQKFSAGMVVFSDEQMLLADVNGDGGISVVDATEIQKYSVGLASVLD